MSKQIIIRILRPTAHIPTIRHFRPIRSIIITRSIGKRPTTISNINTTIIIPAIIIPPIPQIAHSCCIRNPARNPQSKPENEITSDVRARVYPPIAREEGDNVDYVPDDGEAECDEHPGEENREAGIEVGVSIVLGVVVGRCRVMDGYRPGYGADGCSGEENGEDAEEEFPDVGGVVCGYCGA